MKPFAKGKRGLTYLDKIKEKTILVKKKNPEASINTIKHEADILKIINKVNIGPKFIKYDKKNDALIREFIDGIEILDYFNQLPDKKKNQEIIRVLVEVFEQCRKLDLLGLNKFEMTRPYKHILIVTKSSNGRKKGEVIQIDFERCKKTEKPKNVTQFIQACSRGKIGHYLIDQGFKFNILSLGKEYKKELSEDIFDQIIYAIGGKRNLSFSEQVYSACARIPKGTVVSYKELGELIGNKAYRAIGSALSKNPYAPRVPCHRVVGSNGIGGFMGSTKGKAIEKKKKLLREEGVIF